MGDKTVFPPVIKTDITIFFMYCKTKRKIPQNFLTAKQKFQVGENHYLQSIILSPHPCRSLNKIVFNLRKYQG